MKWVRWLLDRLGYVLWKRQFLRYGYEPWLDIQRLSHAWQIKIDVVFDVGANVGQTAAVALKEFPSARVYSFEPHPPTFWRLSAAFREPRFSAHLLAFGECSGDAVLYEYASEGDGSQINTLVANARFPTQFGYQAKELKVRCTTIDEFCTENKITRIDVLKIDTEGFELSVLKGAGAMLRDQRVTFILAEYNDIFPKLGTTGGSLVPLAEFLCGLGYDYVTTYTDRIMEHDRFVSSNALFARWPSS